jgi:hypothetical protein
MTAYIDAERDRYGVEPICRVLQFPPPRTTPQKRAQRQHEAGATTSSRWRSRAFGTSIAECKEPTKCGLSSGVKDTWSPAARWSG